MVSAWWLVLAFFLGGSAGMLVMAIMALARDVAQGERAPMRVPVFRTHLP